MTDPRIEKIARALAILNVEEDTNWHVYVDDAQAALNAIMGSSNLWEPFKTVPMDGTVVDLWVKHHIHGEQRVTDAKVKDSKWVFGKFNEPLNPDWRVTHWMYPPKSPNSKEDAK